MKIKNTNSKNLLPRRFTPGGTVMLLLLILTLSIGPVFGQLINNVLDKTYGGDGRTTLDINMDDRVKDIVVQNDGKIVVGGWSGMAALYDFALARYTSDGSLDNSFDTDGKVSTDISGVDDQLEGLAIQADGRIIAIGSTNNGGSVDWAIVRYGTDGSLDNGFGTNGVVKQPIGTGSDYAYAVAVQSDGKIIVAGTGESAANTDMAVIRLNSDGSLDNGFGTNGIVDTSFVNTDYVKGLAIQADGKIVVGGYGSDDKEFTVLRLNTDGSFDTGFGSNGVYRTSLSYGLISGGAIALQGDGKIVVGGSVYDSDNEFYLFRLTTSGSLDNTFGTSGVTVFDVSNGADDYLTDIAIQEDDKIMAAGAVRNGSPYKFGVARFLADGSPDPGFATSSKEIINVGGGSNEDWAYAAALQADGHILMAGHSNDGTDNNFAVVRLSGATQLLPIATDYWTGSGASGIPLSPFYSDIRHQSLYLASDLESVGIPAWSSITKIDIIPSEVPGMDLSNFRIAYALTSITQFSDYSATTVVYGPSYESSSNFSQGEWQSFSVDNIVWDGVKNIVIEFNHDNQNTDSQGGIYLREAGTNRAIKGQSLDYSNTYPYDNSYPKELVNQVAAIRLTYEQVIVRPASELVLSAGDSEIDLSWTASSDGDLSEYLIFRGTTSNNLVRIDSVNSGTTSYTDENLTNGVTYYYGVKAKNSAAELSEFTNVESEMPEYSGPKNITVANSDTRAALNWETPGGTVAAYFIYRGTAANTTTELDSLGSGKTYYLDSELTNGTAYYYRLKAKFNDGSFSSYSENFMVTPDEYTMTVDGNITDWTNIRQIHNDPVGDVGYADIDSVKFNADGFYLYGAVVTNSDLGSDLLDIYFDTDFNASTGMQESGIGADYKLTISPWGTDEFLFRNEFNNWEADGDADFNVVSSNGNRFHEFSIHLDELDSPDSLRFYLSTNSNDKAPDAGYLAYQLDPNDAPREFFVGTGDTKANLNWKADNSSGYNKYLVYRGTAADPTTLIATLTTGTPLQSYYQDSDLTNGTTYYYRLRAQYADNSYSDYTQSIAVKPNMYAISIDGAIADWANINQLYGNDAGDVGSADIDSVKIYCNDQNLYGSIVTTSDLGWDEVLIYIDSDLNSATGFGGNNIGAEYQLRISPNNSDVFRYYNGNWQDSWDTDFTVIHSNNNQFHEFRVGLGFLDNPESVRFYYQTNSSDYIPDDGYYLTYNTTKVAPNAPSGLTALADSAQVTLRWSANDPAKLHKYNIYRGTSTPAMTLIDSLVAASPPDTVYVDDGLTNGQTYYYAISAVDSTGRESEKSKEVISTPNRYHEQLAELLLTNAFYAPENDAGYPFSTYYYDVKHQSLYLAQDFSEAGIPAGAWFSSLELKPSTVTIEIKNFRLALSATNNTELSNFVDLQNSIMHGPNTYNQSEFTDDTWKRFGITPYRWDGASNLILEASQDADFYTNTAGGIHIRQVNGTRGLRGGNDGYGVTDYPFGGMSLTTPEDKVLALRVAYSTIEPVGNFTATPGHQQIGLTWTAPQSGTVAEYIVYSGTSTSTLEPVGTTTGTSFTVTDLTNQTLYYVGVQVKSSTAEYSSVTLDQVMPAWIGPNWYVDAVNGNTGAEGSPDDPLLTIQGGINIAPAGDTVFVLPGRYERSLDQNLSFSVSDGSGGYFTKNLVLLSRGGPDSTIIDGEGNVRLFDIYDGTDTTTQVIGFSIRNGYSDNWHGSAISIEENSQIVFKNCVIDSNYSTNGPAVNFNNNAKAWFVDCVIADNNFNNNTNNNGGGAFYLAQTSQLYLNRCQVVNNQITSTSNIGNGAAVCVYWDNTNRFEAVNTLFAGNDCPQQGSALYLGNGKATLINCTIADNESQDAAIAVQDGYLTVFNSIVYGNTPSFQQVGFYGSVSHSIAYSILENEDPDDYENGVKDWNPEFTAGYALHDRSPAIGRGAFAGEDVLGSAIAAPGIDINGVARPTSGTYGPDLGAFENAYLITPYPSAPNVVDANALHKAVEVSWNPSDSTDVVRYYVYQSSDSTNWTVVDTLEGYTTSPVIITGLTNKLTYWFGVTAIDGDGYESSLRSSQRVIPAYQGPVWYVDASASGLMEGSLEAPFQAIKFGIEAADVDGGDTVYVLPGHYENDDNQYLNFAHDYNNDGNYDAAKNLVLLSRDGPDSTHIDGGGYGRLFEFTHGEDTSSQVIGFHIYNAGAEGSVNEGSAITINGNSGAIFRNCVIDSNLAHNTPAIYVAGETSEARFINCVIKDNVSTTPVTGYYDVYGGAFNVSGNAELYLSRCTLLRNEIYNPSGGWSYGGAIYIGTGSANIVTITNSVLAENTTYSLNASMTAGNAIYNNGGKVSLTNCTVVDNYSTEGAAIWLNSGSYFTLFNSIVYDNTPSENQIAWSGSFTKKITYSIWENFNSTYASTGVFDDDPRLDGYVLNDRSPAIGAGAASSTAAGGAAISAPAIDRNGAARPQPDGSSPDLGAFENSWATSPYPDPVAGLATLAGDEQVSLSWDASSGDGLSHYVVYQSNTPNFMPAVGDSTGRVDVPDTEFTATGLSNDLVYYYKVSVVDTAGRESEFAVELNAQPNAYNLQVVELLHTNTPSNPTSVEGYPFHTDYWHDVRHQSLYLQEDLDVAGIPANAWITAVEIKPSAFSGEVNNLRLGSTFLANTTDQITDWQTVNNMFGPVDYNAAMITIDSWERFNVNPFQWDGVKNWVLEYTHDNDNATGNDGGAYLFEVDDTRGLRGYVQGWSYPFSGYMNNISEEIVLAVRLVYSLVEPVANLKAEPQHHAIELSWDAPGAGADHYLVYSGSDPDSLVLADTAYTTTATITDLANGDTYYFGVQAVSGTDYSGIISVEGVPAYRGPVWYVHVEATGPLYEGSPEDPALYIRNAIWNTNNGDTILLKPGTYSGSNNRELNFQFVDEFENLTTSPRSLVLMGEKGADSTTIDLSGIGVTERRLLEVISGEGVATKLVGLTVINGEVSASAALIKVEGSQLTIEDCVFKNNINSDNSGAIVISGNNTSQITVDRTLFRDNTSPNSVGVIYADNVDINNSIFFNNSARIGSAVFWNAPDGSRLHIVNSTFLNNASSESGGALYLQNPTTFSIYNSIFWGNSGAGNPDIEPLRSGVHSCIVQDMNGYPSDNFSFDPMISDPANGDFSLSDFSPAIGIGVEQYYNYKLIANTPIPEYDYLGSSRPDPAGSMPDLGAIEHWRSESRKYVWLVATDGNDGNDGLENPFATIQKAIDTANEEDTVEVAAGTYTGSGNKGLEFEGKNIVLRSASGPDATVINLENDGFAFDFYENEPPTAKVVGFTIQNGNNPGGDGGAIRLQNSSPTFNRVKLVNNISNQSGGAIFAQNSNSTFVNSVIAFNSAAVSGGAALLDGGNVTFAHCTIANNQAGNNSSIAMTAGNHVVHNSILWNNTVDGFELADNAGNSGTAYVAVSHSNVMGLTPENSNVLLRPGFLDPVNGDFRLAAWSPMIGLADTASFALFDYLGNSRSVSDTTWPDIGAYEHGNRYSDLSGYDRIDWYVATNGDNGNAGSIGGPFASLQYASYHALYDDTVRVQPGTYNQTVAIKQKPVYFVAVTSADQTIIDGGGQRVFDYNGCGPDAVYLSGLTIRNGSSDNGAGIKLYNSDGFLRNLIVSGNTTTASNGGGLWAYADDYTRVYTLDIINSSFNNNSAVSYGGGLRITDIQTTIANCEISGNSADHYSGLAFSGESADLTMTDCRIVDNTAINYGAGVGISIGASASLTRVLVADNTANTSGDTWNSGGLSAWNNAVVTLNNCTFANNSASYGSGLTVGGGASATITQSIFWGNTPDQLALDVWTDEGTGGTVDISYSLIEDGQAAVTGTGDILNTLTWGAGNRDKDPVFNNDYKLLAGSAAVNGGNPDSTDSDGTRRDMGISPYLTTHTGPDWYVNATAGSDVDGQGSLFQPFASVQAGVNFALTNDTVRVAEGTYHENVEFRGQEICLEGSGFNSVINGNGIAPALQIVGPGYTAATTVRQFSLTNGSTTLGTLNISGCSPTLEYLWLRDGTDGVYTYGGNPVFNYCLMTDNTANGFMAHDGYPVLVNNTIANNQQYGISAGGNCTVTIRNGIISHNNVSLSGGSVSATYSDIVGGGLATNGNKDADPLFVDAAAGNYNLKINSPCIDAGYPADSDDPDGTTRDMGAFYKYRSFVSGTTTGNVTISDSTTAVIDADLTVDSGDTLTIDPGATVYVQNNVSIRVNGTMAATGSSGRPIQFRTVNPGDHFNGIYLPGSTPTARAETPVYSYLLISDVNPDSIPLTVDGDAVLEHVTIAGNGNDTSLVTTGTVNLKYSLLEGTVGGYSANTGSLTGITLADHFVDAANGDFDLIATSTAIDVGVAEASAIIDPDFTYTDAGAFYHDQSTYPVQTVEVVYPASGQTVDVSPDSSSSIGSGLTVSTRFYNEYGRARTNALASWSPNIGTIDVSDTDTTNLDGIWTNTLYTTTTAGDANTFTVTADGQSGTSGTFNVVPGAPDSLLLAGGFVGDTTMTQLDTIDIVINVQDQFDNLVQDGETVEWALLVAGGDGIGFEFSSNTTTTSGGSTTVRLRTDPALGAEVGDAVQAQAVSNGAHVNTYSVTIVPDDIFNLTLADSLTSGEIPVSADVASITITATMVDTFTNPLENVAVNWTIVESNNTAGELSAISTLTDASGEATVTLTTGTVTDYTYKVVGLVQEEALLAVADQIADRSLQATGVIRTTDKNGRITLTSTGIPVFTNPITLDNWSREAIFDLEDTTAVIRVVPGVPEAISFNLAADTVITQLDMLEVEVQVFDQFGNRAEDGLTVTWGLNPLVGTGDGFTFTSATSLTSGGSATVTLNTTPHAALVVGNKIQVNATCEGVVNSSGEILVVVDDPYALAIEDGYERTIVADFPNIPVHVTLIDTFTNPLNGIPVYWSIIEGSGGTFANGKILDTTYTGLEAVGWASDTLHLSNLAGSEYRVRIWTENVGGYSAGSVEFDLDDTTDVITVLPGAPNTITTDDADTVYVVQGQIDTLTISVWDAFNNLVSDGSAITWNTTTAGGFTVTSQDNVTGSGEAELVMAVDNSAAWLAKIDVDIEVTSVFDATAAQRKVVYIVEDVIPPAPITAAMISPAGWTNDNAFDLSWTNPAEHSGVAGVYYQIDDNAAAYVALDDIANLDDIAVNVNGHSTLKVWLQDKAGNSDPENAVELTAKWDNVIPGNFSLVEPANILDADDQNNWINAVNPFFKWNLATDATAGMMQYRIVVDAHTYLVQATIDTLRVPDNLNETSHTVTIFAVDSAGNEIVMNSGNTGFEVDVTHPNIAHNVPEGNVNSAITITATITDSYSGIDSQLLYYRKGGESDANWESRDLTLQNQIPSTAVTSTGVEYYIKATDMAGNVYTHPATGFNSIEVSITGSGFQSSERWPLGIPNGTSVSAYQLISFPGIASSKSPTNILVDDLGSYDDTKWRFFTYESSDWVEFASIAEIDDGKGYFLITKDANKTITTSQTRTVVTNEPYEISVPSSEWIVIGNPFNFEIPLSNVYDQDNVSISGSGNFKTWENGNWVSASSLEPWCGYIYKSATGGTLYINPRNTNGGTAKVLADNAIYLGEKEWLIDIEVLNGFTQDITNQVGALSYAADGYDKRLDFFEPPMLPKGTALRIDNRAWEENGGYYSSDIRKVNEEGHYWDMEIEAHDYTRNAKVRFYGMEDLPEEFDIFLVDVSLGIAQNLQGRSEYEFVPGKKVTTHTMRLLIGTKEFVSENSPVELYPDAYSLGQNFPNPFNPRTTILISIEEEANVDLVIYNLLGEEVCRLANNEHLPAGYYPFIWNGRNDFGKRAASGIYFYRAVLMSPDGKLILNKTRKMVLVK